MYFIDYINKQLQETDQRDKARVFIYVDNANTVAAAMNTLFNDKAFTVVTNDGINYRISIADKPGKLNTVIKCTLIANQIK